MLSARKFLALLPLPLLLGGCGFQPLYGGSADSANSPSVAARMDEIEIGLLPNRSGQLLREALEADLHRAGAPVFYRYHLAVHYTLNSEIAGIQPDTSYSRNRLMAQARWRLTPSGNHSATIVQGNAMAMDAVNIIENQYFALSLANNAADRQLAREIAGQIAQQIAIYLKTHQNT